jgi:hypothetical protein
MRVVQTGQDVVAWLSPSPEGYTVAAVCCCRQWAVDTEVETPRMCCKGSTLLMGSAIWLASATGLVGVALGGLVSLAVSRQQIQEARALRADEASQEWYLRNADRRFNAFSEFMI